MFRKSGLKDPVIKPSNQRPSMSTTNSFGNLQTVEEAQIGDFAATRSEIPIGPFNDPQNPAQVVQTIGDFAVTNPRYVWARVKVVDGTVSFDSVSKFDLRTTVASVKVRTSPVTRGSPYVIFTRSQGRWYAIFEPSPGGPYVIFGRSPLWRISE
jgi:hypothetical protein